MRRLRTLVVPAVAVTVVATGLAACGDDAGSDGGKTKLVIATFGEFGYGPLYREYEKTHDVQITERVTKAEDHHKNLAAHLATNRGAADIEGIEEGWIGQFKAQPDKFHNLNDLGAESLKSQWPEWKWETSVAKNGAQLGLGTDVGGLAMCYRRDLFEKAGLPTDRDQVSALWPTWDDYIATGKKFKAAGHRGRRLHGRPDGHVPLDPRPGRRRPTTTTPTTSCSRRTPRSRARSTRPPRR